MVDKELLVRRGGSSAPVLSPVTEVWYRNSASLLARASAAYVVQWAIPGNRTSAKLISMFEGLPAPTSLTAPAKDATSVTLKWGAVTGAVKYQILQRVGAVQGNAPYTVRKEIVPSSGSAWTNRTWKVSTGFTKNNEYILSVRAINSVGQIGPETNPAIKYSPGRDEKSEKSPAGGVTTSFPPVACASYDSEQKWTRHPAQPTEGFVKGSTTQNRNRWGCIDYSNVYEKLVEKHGKASNGVVIADKISVTDTYLKDIVRADDNHPTEATMHFHPGSFAIGVAKKPEITTSGVNDTSQDCAAPAAGKARGFKANINDNKWGQKWAAKSHATNGLILRRDDGKGAVRMEGINPDFPNNWVLVLTYTWNIIIQTSLGPSTASWPFTG